MKRELLSEAEFPLHILLRQLQSEQERIRDDAFRMILYRFSGLFRHYAQRQLGLEDEAQSATDDSFLKLHRSRLTYREKKCLCVKPCECIEKAALSYIWEIQKNTVHDYMRKLALIIEQEVVDETYPAPENPFSSPDAYIEKICWQETLCRAWEKLSEIERYLLSCPPMRGRPVAKRIQARADAVKHFKENIQTELAKEDQ